MVLGFSRAWVEKGRGKTVTFLFDWLTDLLTRSQSEWENCKKWKFRCFCVCFGCREERCESDSRGEDLSVFKWWGLKSVCFVRIVLSFCSLFGSIWLGGDPRRCYWNDVGFVVDWNESKLLVGGLFRKLVALKTSRWRRVLTWENWICLLFFFFPNSIFGYKGFKSLCFCWVREKKKKGRK